jgi:hypothetical protein
MATSYDVNVFMREFIDPVSGDVFLDDCFTVAVYEYYDTSFGSSVKDTEFRLRLTPEETAQVLVENPVEEFGTDWWESAQGFSETAPARVQAFLNELPVLEETVGVIVW